MRRSGGRLEQNFKDHINYSVLSQSSCSDFTQNGARKKDYYVSGSFQDDLGAHLESISSHTFSSLNTYSITYLYETKFSAQHISLCATCFSTSEFHLKGSKMFIRFSRSV